MLHLNNLSSPHNALAGHMLACSASLLQQPRHIVRGTQLCTCLHQDSEAQALPPHSVRVFLTVGLQGEAIAVNLREMFGFSVPILSVVIGEGGSGGALAIGCANHNLIMEHSVYYVASPEACAAILWKSRDKAAAVCLALCLYIFNLRLQKPAWQG